jgi:hypothetical protein
VPRDEGIQSAARRRIGGQEIPKLIGLSKEIRSNEKSKEFIPHIVELALTTKCNSIHSTKEI